MEFREYKIVLETKSPFRIGGGKDPFSAIDQPIIKIGEKIVIPGTTLKGALRESLEKYLIQNYSDKEGMKPCIPASERTLSEDEKRLIKIGKYKGASCHYPCKIEKDRQTGKDQCSIVKIGSDKIEINAGMHYICPVCYLLGAQGLVGFVTVPFLSADVTPSELPAIRIDRAKQTVAGERGAGAYRTYQILPEGVTFEGVLTVLIRDDLRGWELGKPRPLQDVTLGDLWLQKQEWDMDKIIKEFIIKRLEAINVLGGLKSTGAGRIKIKVEN